MMFCLLVLLTVPRIFLSRARNQEPGQTLYGPFVAFIIATGALFMATVLPAEQNGILVIWILSGLLVFLAYARRGLSSMRARDYVGDETVAEHEREKYRVLVCASSIERSRYLLRLASRLAQQRAGALLLFLTNLSAIILSAAVVFLMLGFRPTRSAKGGVVRRSIVLVTLGIMIVSIPLAFSTWHQAVEARIAGHVERMFRKLAAEEFHLQDFAVTRVEGRYDVNMAVYSTRAVKAEGIEKFQRKLEERVNAPVRIRLVAVEASIHLAGAGVTNEVLIPENAPAVLPESPTVIPSAPVRRAGEL